MDKLKKLRERIDWLDSQIASLLNERMRAADQIGKIKKESHQEVTDLSREKIVLSSVEKMVQHPVLKADIANIYNEIMHESKIAQQFYQHQSQPFRRIGIIGLGLMGGSICKAIKLKDASIEINTLTLSSEDHLAAKTEGWVDNFYSSIGSLIQNTELIILATPISSIVQLAEEIKQHAGDKKIIVIDIGSLKEDIVKNFAKLTEGTVEYIGTHPMAGKVESGFANSQATLFVNRPWIIVPHQDNTLNSIESIKNLILFLGAKPLTLEAKVHDQKAALASHLPSILSKSYFDFVNDIEPECLNIAGPGFQSFTRLAHDNQAMRDEINAYNQKTINAYLKLWLEHLIKSRGL